MKSLKCFFGFHEWGQWERRVLSGAPVAGIFGGSNFKIGPGDGDDTFSIYVHHCKRCGAARKATWDDDVETGHSKRTSDD